MGFIRAVLDSLFVYTKKFYTHQKHKKHKTLQTNSKGMVVQLNQ